MTQPAVGQSIRVVGPFEPDMPEHSLVATIKTIHVDGTVDVDMTSFGLTFKERVPFMTGDEAAPSTSFCEPLDSTSRYRLA